MKLIASGIKSITNDISPPMNEYSILPEIRYGGIVCYNERREGTHRHEVFFGNPDRQLSIKYGLVVYLLPEYHNMSNQGVHFDSNFDKALKRVAQKEAMKHYQWSLDDWMKIFRRNYL